MKKWFLVFVFGLLAMGSRAAMADTYILATSSWTTTTVLVSSSSWTQMDTPTLSGRTSIEIYNVDPSSPIYCRQDNLPSVSGIRIDQVQPANTRPIPPSTLTGTVFEGKWSMALSNFASNRGAYPVSAPMPVYCISAAGGKAGVVQSTATVVQSY